MIRTLFVFLNKIVIFEELILYHNSGLTSRLDCQEEVPSLLPVSLGSSLPPSGLSHSSAELTQLTSVETKVICLPVPRFLHEVACLAQRCSCTLQPY